MICGPSGTQERLEKLWSSAYPSVLEKGVGFTIEYIECPVPGDVEVLGRRLRTLRAQHDSFAIASSIRITTDAIDLAFSGDTGWHSPLGTFVESSDIFICECSNVTADYWGHLSVEEIRTHRSDIDVGQLYLSHMSQSSREAAQKAVAVLDATIADDGMRIHWP